jgi:hypothetical protein
LRGAKKLSENEEKFMETIKATVVEFEEKHFIKIEIGQEDIKIPISEDRSNEVKSAFNKLIIRIKEGLFQIALSDIGQDLFSQVANEYVTQLNREIQEVHGEMKGYGLVKDLP